MYKPSEILDFTDKAMEIHNGYVEEQKHRIAEEIKWLSENEGSPNSLRLYLAKLYDEYLVLRLDDENLHQLAQIRGNILYGQWNQLCQQKINTTPLKVIAKELKCFGK